MTSATEELRRLLDERGVEWWEGWDKDLTCYDGANGVRYIADATLGEMFFRSMLPVTPAQAVEATLGRGTCHVESVARNEYGYAPQVSDYTFELSCGHSVTWDEQPDYCPWCGREVVE